MLLHVVDGDDPRMLELGSRPRFLDEAGDLLGGLESFSTRHLQGDRPIQLRIVGQVDDAKATSTKSALNFVATNLFGRGSSSVSVSSCNGG